MNANRQVFHISSEGSTPQAIQESLLWIKTLTTNDPTKSNVLIVVNQKSVMDGVISKVLGEDSVKSLKDGKIVNLGSVAKISMATEKTLPTSWNGPILAIYPSKRTLDKIDELTDVTDVLLIPWDRSEIQFWIDTWASNELGGSTNASPITTLDPILETALISLSSSVNRSTGLAHPSDRTATIQMFQVLFKNNIHFDLGDVRAWLVSKGGWAPTDADKVITIASGVVNGKRFQTKGRMWRSDIFDIWKKDASKLGGGA